MITLLSIRSHGWLIVSLAAYTLAACYNLREPGANYDEMLYAAPAVNFVTGLENTEPMQINPSVVRLAGRPFPLMIMTYIGGLKAAWHAVVFAALGVSIESARFASVLLGILAIAATYGFLRRFLGQSVADLTSMLMGCSVEWVFYSSRDMTIVVMVLCKMTAWYGGYRYWQGGGLRWLGLAGGALGLGLYDKTSFLWFLVACIAYAVLFERRKLTTIRSRAWLVAMGTFIAAASVFIAFNVARLGASFVPIASQWSTQGVRISDLPVNLLTRLDQWVGLMTGEAIMEVFTGRGYEQRWFPYAVLSLIALAMIVGSWRWVRGNARPDARKIALAMFMCFFPLVLTVYSPTVLSLHHVAIAWPFHWILVAVSLTWIRRMLSPRVAMIMAGLVVGLQVAGTGQVYSRLEREGAVGNWSETIYELSDELVRRDQPVVAVSWGFTDNLLVTSQGRIKLVRLYRELVGTETATREELLRKHLSGGRLFLVRTDQQPDDEGMFRRVAEQEKYRLRLEREFFQKNGRPIYRLYSVHGTG